VCQPATNRHEALPDQLNRPPHAQSPQQATGLRTRQKKQTGSRKKQSQVKKIEKPPRPKMARWTRVMGDEATYSMGELLQLSVPRNTPTSCITYDARYYMGELSSFSVPRGTLWANFLHPQKKRAKRDRKQNQTDAHRVPVIAFFALTPVHGGSTRFSSHFSTFPISV